MTKKSAKRKRAEYAEEPSKTKAKPELVTPPPEPESLQSLISEEELEITVETLQTLSSYPTIIKSKSCKSLRSAIYDVNHACTGALLASADTTLTARISAALSHDKFLEALILLAEMRIMGEAPKLGALCRWVRQLEVVSGLSMQVDGVSCTTTPRSEKDLKLLRVLDAVLRVTGLIDTHLPAPSGSSPISLQKSWTLRGPSADSVQVRKSVLDSSIFAGLPTDIKGSFSVVSTTPGQERKPPNHHPAIVFLSKENTILLTDPCPQPKRIPHPVVPNLAIIKDVLSTKECLQIVAAAEKVGFTPDAPVADISEEVSVLAHNFYWIVDQAFHDKLWTRVRDHVPAQVDGRKARGINRRFRVYRYVPGAEYRCHIDGAWPPSGFHPVTKAYQYDSSPPEARQSSLFTFLIYLNDEFEAGETTFFMPSPVDGIMNAYPVTPIMGSVAVFPHGEARGALLHEGTGVRNGAKYVIRTDVEYDVLASATDTHE